MPSPIIFPYKIYKGIDYPIISFDVKAGKKWVKIEAYVDSGASVSLFSIIEAQRLKIDYKTGKKTFSMVGDGSRIPVYLHSLLIKVSDISFKATVGFSPRLGVGFNLIGRKDFFDHFDITFSDSTKTLVFLPVNK